MSYDTVNMHAVCHDFTTYNILRCRDGEWEGRKVDNPFSSHRDLSVEYVEMLQTRENRVAANRKNKPEIYYLYEEVSKVVKVHSGDIQTT